MSTGTLSRRAAFLRWVGHTSCLLPLLTLIICNGRAADYSQTTQRRDGTWLRDGIDQYERLNVLHETLSEEERNRALAAGSYVCAIVDLERYLVLRADLLAGAVAQGRKKHRATAERLEGMAAAIPIIVPLMQTSFSADGASCDTVVVMVADYLGKYPEMLTKDAGVIIERAMLDAYSTRNVPQ